MTATDVLGSQETTAQVHPEQFTRAIAEQAQKEGLQIVYGTAERLERTKEGGDHYAVTISPRKDNDDNSPRVLEFDQIVIAAGPWTGRLLSSLGLGGGGGDNNNDPGSLRARAGRAKAIRGSRAHSIVVRAPEGKTLPAQALFTSIKEQKGRHAEPEIYSKPVQPSFIIHAEMISELGSRERPPTEDWLIFWRTLIAPCRSTGRYRLRLRSHGRFRLAPPRFGRDHLPLRDRLARLSNRPTRARLPRLDQRGRGRKGREGTGVLPPCGEWRSRFGED